MQCYEHIPIVFDELECLLFIHGLGAYNKGHVVTCGWKEIEQVLEWGNSFSDAKP